MRGQGLLFTAQLLRDNQVSQPNGISFSSAASVGCTSVTDEQRDRNTVICVAIAGIVHALVYDTDS